MLFRSTGAQFIIATHSPILLAYPDAPIYACTEDGVTRSAYEETEHFLVTRDFLANPQRMLSQRLREDENTESEPPGSWVNMSTSSSCQLSPGAHPK